MVKKIIFLFFSIFLASFFLVLPVFAFEIKYPSVPGAIAPQNFGDRPSEEIISLYIKYFFNLTIWLIGIIAFGVLVYAGIQYLTSTGKPEKIISAKERMSAAFFGILLLLSSFLILKILSPQFIVLKIPTLKPVEIPEKEKIPFPEERIMTSIDAEMPFGRIIEGKIFESYISDYPKPEEEKEPRMKRIKENAKNILTYAEHLANNSEELKRLTLDDPRKCSCGLARPNCSPCVSGQPCTCDPCSYVRSSIQSAENDNLMQITNLLEEQRKTTEEIHSLKEEVGRLERAEKFIEECPLRNLYSYAQFLEIINSYELLKTFAQSFQLLRSLGIKIPETVVTEIKFWDDINIVYKPYDYLNKKEKGEPDNDFATFYCAVGGIVGEEYPLPLEPEEHEEWFTGEETEEEVEKILEERSKEETAEELGEEMASIDEAPIGEIIDRAKRTAKLLIMRLEKLVNLGKKMIKAVDDLQVLVSQCSSQRCSSLCIEVCDPITGICICVVKKCVGDPCPAEDIKKQLEKINGIKEEINKLVNGKLEGETLGEKKEKIGILSLIDDIIPKILADLDFYVRIPMKRCTADEELALVNCIQAKGATTPEEGKVIHLCCVTEQWKDGKKEQTVYGDCFEECFLEKGIEKHRECVENCLDRKGQELNDEELPFCFNRLNFYCLPSM